MIRDMIQFGAIFAVFLFSFSGAFYLALRGEDRTQMEGVCVSDCNATNVTVAENESSLVPPLNTSLNLYPFETSWVDYIIVFGEH